MRHHPQGSTKAVTDYIREKAREAVIKSDPECGNDIAIPIEVYVGPQEREQPQHQPKP